MQDSQANCGAFALLNSLKALGIDRTAAELEAACGTTATDGTTTRGLVKASSKIEGCTPGIIRERKADVAMLRLDAAVRRGRPVIFTWDNGTHWVAAVGILGERYLVADSADNELVIVIDARTLEAQWRDEGRYEAVVI